MTAPRARRLQILVILQQSFWSEHMVLPTLWAGECIFYVFSLYLFESCNGSPSVPLVTIFFFFCSSSHQFFPLQGRRTQGSEQTFRVAGTVFLQADHGKLFRKVPGLLCKLLVGFEEENSAGRYDPLYICSPQGFALMW